MKKSTTSVALKTAIASAATTLNAPRSTNAIATVAPVHAIRMPKIA